MTRYQFRTLRKVVEENYGTLSNKCKFWYFSSREIHLYNRFDLFQGSIIVIEEDLILSPDFLYTLALLYETYKNDDSIAGIQMWNPNCKKIILKSNLVELIVSFCLSQAYENVDGSVELIYRVDTFHGLGYLIRKTFVDKYMKDSFSTCCSKR